MNVNKSNYMSMNFTKNYQFSTIVSLEEKAIQQITHTKLLCVMVDDSLYWQANTNYIVRQAYKRMNILQNPYKFSVPLEDLIFMYILYIQAGVENSAIFGTAH